MATLLELIHQVSEEKENEISRLQMAVEIANSDIRKLENKIIELKNANFRLKQRLKAKTEKENLKTKVEKEKNKEKICT